MLYTESMDELLESNNNKKSKTKKYTAMIAIGVMAASTVGLYLYNNNTAPTNSVNAEDISTNENSAVNSNGTVTKKIINPINTNSNLINANNKDKIERAGQFQVPTNLKDNQIARHVAQEKFTGKEYLPSLISESESFRSHLYNDNIGYAFGNGWNISMQTTKYNENLAKAISIEPEFIKKITTLSGKISSLPIGNYQLTITPQKSMQVSMLMAEKFEEAAINAISKQMMKNKTTIAQHKATKKDYKVLAKELYASLATNEQAVLVYHAYKVGEYGFGKYTGMIESLIDYANAKERTPELAKKVAEHFTYKYKMNGEIKQDTRAEVLIQSMFMDVNAFGYLIAKNVAPRNMKTNIPAIQNNNINTSVKSEQLIIPDPVGEMREKLEKEGKKIQIIPDFSDYKFKPDPSEQSKPKQGTHARFM